MRLRWSDFGGLIGQVILVTCLTRSMCIVDTVIITPTKDNTLIESSAKDPRSNGAGEWIFTGRTGVAGENRALRAVLAFDIAGSIPVGSTIHCASLKLQLQTAAQVSGDQTHTLHKLLADWGEGTSSAFNGPGMEATVGDATWFNTFWPTSTWASPGGDFVATPSDTQIVSQVLTEYTWNSGEMAANVQDWLDNPPSNFGWILIGNEAANQTARKFGSRENAGNEPVLEIRYSPPGSCLQDCVEPLNNRIDINDLRAIILGWGSTDSTCDIDSPCGDGIVNINDLREVILNWGDCP